MSIVSGHHLDLNRLVHVVFDSTAAVGSPTVHTEVLRRACHKNAHFVDYGTGEYGVCIVSIGVVR